MQKMKAASFEASDMGLKIVNQNGFYSKFSDYLEV